MAGKVLSIEVGYSITRVIEMDYEAKNPKVYNTFSFETPPDVLSDEGIAINESLIALMRQEMSQSGIHTNRAVFTISSTRIATRDVTIPLVKDNKIKQLLIANSKEYFPVDLTQYELVYRVTERMKEEKQLKLAVFAVPRTLIDSYKQLAKAWGLQLIGLDYNGNSVYQAMTRYMPVDFAVTLRVDDRSSMITIVKDGKIELQRSIGYGVDEAVEIVRTCKVLGTNASYIDAVDLMRRKTCLNPQIRMEASAAASTDVEEPAIMDIRDDVTRALTMLVGNVSRVIDYYTSRNQEVTISKIHLIGLGADCSGLSKLLTNELGIKVVSLQELDSNLNRNLSSERYKVAEFMTCIGATFAPLNFAMDEEHKGKDNSGKDSLVGSVVIAALIAVAGLGLVAFSAVRNISLKADQIMLNAQINSMSYIDDVVAAYDQATQDYVWSENVRMLSENENENMVDFIEEMEEKMPSEIRVLSLSATEESVSMNIEVGTKTEAASVIAKLRNFESIHVIPSGISTITETRDEFDNSVVSFSLECKYASSDVSEDNAESSTDITEDAQEE